MTTIDPDLTIIGVVLGDLPESRPADSPEQPKAFNQVESLNTASSDPVGAIQLVQGSRPKMDDETQELLHQRLRAAAVVLFVAVFAFWIRSFFLTNAPVRWLQPLVAAVLAVSIWRLSTVHQWTLRALRRAELGLFWTTAVLLSFYQFSLLWNKAHEGDATGALGSMKSCVIYSFGVIILYGTFIPNRWQRSVRIVGPIALVPGIAPIILRFVDPEVRHISQHVATFEQVSDNVLILFLGVLTSTYGTYIINTLREESYRARQLGQYRLKELLGKGGMGEVYLAEHRLLKRKCAIKLIRADHQTDPQAMIRFEREVRTTAGLSHPNTIDVYDYGRTEDGTFFYVMEFLPGMNLTEIVRRYGPIPPERAVYLLSQTCAALREAHDVGLIHRDIKPANIFAAKRGGQYDIAKLLDFGLVRSLKHHGPKNPDVIAGQPDEERGLSGSIHFMAPEQADTELQADQRSDIYSLGATAYFLVTGQPPFLRDHGLQVLRAHAEEPVIPPSHLSPGLPPDVEDIILKCLEKSPGDRFATVVALEEAFRNCSVAGRWNAADALLWWSQHEEIMA